MVVCVCVMVDIWWVGSHILGLVQQMPRLLRYISLVACCASILITLQRWTKIRRMIGGDKRCVVTA
jgi:hypothetical protein